MPRRVLDWKLISSDGGWHKRRKNATVVYQGSIYMIGGFYAGAGTAVNLNDVWKCDDGVNWTRVCESAPWLGRDGHTAVVFQDYIYVFGGTCDAYSCFNDVWRTKNGSTWEQITCDAAWPERWQHAAVVHDGAIYILGGWGMVMLDDVWKSADGVTWTKVRENGPWSKRMFHVAVTFKGYIYLLGGFDGRSYLNDVWRSADGLEWTLVSENGRVDWSPRRGHTAVVFQDKIFVVGGDTGGGVASDVWSSADGEHWELVWSEKACCARIGHSVVVFNGDMLVFGGVDGTGEYLSDTYRTAEVEEPDVGADDDGVEVALSVDEDTITNAGDDFGEWASARSEYETGSFISSATGGGGPGASMASIIVRANQLRDLRAKLHEAWTANLEQLERIEMVLHEQHPDHDHATAAGTNGEGFSRSEGKEEEEEGVAAAATKARPEEGASPAHSPSRPAAEGDPAAGSCGVGDSGPPSPATSSDMSVTSSSSSPSLLHGLHRQHDKLQKHVARLEDIQAGIRRAAGAKAEAEVCALMAERAGRSAEGVALAQQVLRGIEDLRAIQAERHATLDGLCASLLPRLSSAPSCPPSDHLDHSGGGPPAPHSSARLSPIREAGSSNASGEPSFSDMAADIRSALSKLVDRSPSSLSLSMGPDRRRCMSSEYNPSRTDHILGNLEAALAEKRATADKLCDYLSVLIAADPSASASSSSCSVSASPLISPSASHGSLGATTTASAASTASIRKLEHGSATLPPPLLGPAATTKAVAEPTTSSGSAGAPPTALAAMAAGRSRELPANSTATGSIANHGGSSSCSASPSLLPSQPSLRRGVSGGSSEGSWAVVSMARKWDETDMLHRLQNQAHMAINRELMHVPGELDRAGRTGRLMVRAALAEATQELTQLSAAMTEIRSLSETTQAWSERLQQWTDPESLKQRCGEMVKQVNDLEEAILNREDERIDCRSALEKRTQRHAPETELEGLQASMEEAGRAVRALRHTQRKLIGEAAGFAHAVAPELALQLPVILGPRVDSSGSSTAAAHLPRRSLEDYEDVRPWAATEEAPASGRHVMLRARFDGEDVVLKGYALHNEKQLRDLEREMAILGSIQHDGIISVRALVEEEPLSKGRQAVPMLYLEFPYCSGGNLNTWLAAAPRAPWDLQSIARQLLCAVMHLHDRGIIHKDIKPGNILLHADGRLMLADFDLSRDTTQGSSSTSTRVCAGTPGYLAPEVQAGHAASPASDMYSIGVVLYHLHFPQAKGVPPVPGALQLPEGGADSDLTDLIRALLEVEPTRRPTASNALLHPYFRQCYVDRLVTCGELVEQNKKLEAVRALLYRARVELNWDEAVKLEVDRENSGLSLVESLIAYAQSIAPQQLARPVKVTFKGEAGVDQGGLLTETYTLFFTSVLRPDLGLFETAQDDSKARLFYLPVHGPCPSPRLLQCLRTVGQLMAKCFFDGRRLGPYFAPSLFRFIAGVDVSLQDLLLYDPQTSTSLRWLLSTPGAKSLALDFEEVGQSERGAVTDANKAEFVALKVRKILVEDRRRQLEAVRDGFLEAIDAMFQTAAPFLRLLSQADWRVLLCGQENVNAAQVIAVLTFKEFSRRAMERGVPAWLKKAIRGFTQDDLRRFLMFVTGSPSLPVAAVGAMEITVRALMRSNALPVAHTCFNELDVPEYADEETFNEKLKTAMYETGGFDKV